MKASVGDVRHIVRSILIESMGEEWQRWLVPSASGYEVLDANAGYGGHVVHAMSHVMVLPRVLDAMRKTGDPALRLGARLRHMSDEELIDVVSTATGAELVGSVEAWHQFCADPAGFFQRKTESIRVSGPTFDVNVLTQQALDGIVDYVKSYYGDAMGNIFITQRRDNRLAMMSIDELYTIKTPNEFWDTAKRIH